MANAERRTDGMAAVLTPADVAYILGVARSTVTRWGREFQEGRGGLRCFRLPSGRLRFRREDVQALLATAGAGRGDDGSGVAVSESVPG